MDKELRDKLESKKSDGKTTKGCKSCKKKPPMTELPPLIEMDMDMYIPTPDEIRLAYIELGNENKSKREGVNKVYEFLFNERFDWGCTSCINTQARRLKNYIIHTLKLTV